MANNRFIETACEILGEKSPSEIQREELEKLIREHFGEDAKEEEFFEMESGLLYRLVFLEEEDGQD